jgi:hypothetical protein
MFIPLWGYVRQAELPLPFTPPTPLTNPTPVCELNVSFVLLTPCYEQVELSYWNENYSKII